MRGAARAGDFGDDPPLLKPCAITSASVQTKGAALLRTFPLRTRHGRLAEIRGRKDERGWRIGPAMTSSGRRPARGGGLGGGGGIGVKSRASSTTRRSYAR